MQAIPVIGAEESRLPDIKFVYAEAKALLVGMAEDDTTQDDINAKATDYLLTAIESQTAAKELEVTVRDLERGMRNEEEGKAAESEGRNERVRSTIISAKEKVRNFLWRLAGRAKQYGQDLKAALESIPEKMEEMGKSLIDRVARLLKKALEKLSQLMAALIGAMFDFAARVQSIAAKKKFTIKDFEIQIPSSEIQIA